MRALTSHQCGSKLIPRLGVIGGLSLLLVLVLAPGTPLFPSAQKPTYIFQFDVDTGDEESPSRCATANLIYLFIYLFI